MSLVREIAIAVRIVMITLWLQSAGIAALIHWVRNTLASDANKLGAVRSAVLVVRLTTAAIVLHGVLILFWASCYRRLCFSSWESALYFSASSYATVGYGDVVLPSNWRMLGPLESIIGVLMFGISVSVLFAVVTRLVNREGRTLQ
jgi:voltage-gated potassium channel